MTRSQPFQYSPTTTTFEDSSARRGDFEWRHMRLCEIGQVVTGATPSTKEPSFFDGKYMFITPGDIGEARFLSRTERYLTDKGLRVVRELPKNSVVVTCIGIIGKVGITSTERSASNQQINAVIPNAEVILPEFLYYTLLARSSELETLASRTVLPILKKSVFANFRLRVPEIEEQKKIVKILSSIQEAEEARQHELALERERKIALMGHLFTHGIRGEATKPTPIGELPETWGLATLGSLYETQLGKMLSQKARAGTNPKPYLRNANVQWGRVDLSEVYEMDFSESEQKKFALKHGDLLICEGGEIGRTALWNAELAQCYFQKAIHRARPRSANVMPEFLRYWMEWGFRIADVYGVTGTQTTIAHLPQEKLEEMKIPNPPTSEQQEIASVLLSSDARITAVQKEIVVLDELFSASLHQLMTRTLRSDALVSEVTIA